MSTAGESARVDLVGLRICQVIVPVTICSIYVALITRILELDLVGGDNVLHEAWYQLGIQSEGRSFGITLMNSIYVVSVFIILIVGVTLLILLVLYLGLHNYLQYYFYIPSLIIMLFITPVYIRRVIGCLNWFAIDIITLVLFVYNFTALGLIAIFGAYTKAPLLIQQFYLIHNSALLSIVILDSLPDWAPWILLGFLVIWDLFAVLAPIGPLRLIINMAEKGGIVDMPGLVYQTDLVEQTSERRRRRIGSRIKTINSDEEPEPQPAKVSGAAKKQVSITAKKEEVKKEQSQIVSTSSSDSDMDFTERGVNIGLGDFIFYGLLIGLTCKGSQLEDYYTFLATLNAILLGLVITICILAAARRALPALPISIALGMFTAVATMFYAAPFANRLAREQVFI